MNEESVLSEKMPLGCTMSSQLFGPSQMHTLGSQRPRVPSPSGGLTDEELTIRLNQAVARN